MLLNLTSQALLSSLDGCFSSPFPPPPKSIKWSSNVSLCLPLFTFLNRVQQKKVEKYGDK